MKGILVAICIIGALTGSQAARVSLRLNRGLTGNECKGHPHGDLIPYPGDCEKYLVCEYYNGTVMPCPSGLHFNPVLKVCDWPTSAGCNEGGGPIEPPTQPPTQPPTEPPTKPPTEPPTEPPTQPPTEPPTQPPTEPPTKPPTEPSTEPPTEPPTQPPTEPPTQPPTEPPTQPPTEPPTKPPTEPPTQPPTQPPTKPPTEPPTQPPTQPPTEPPTQPPTEPPTQPPTLRPDDNICIGKENGDLAPFPYDCEWYIRCEECSPLVLHCEEGKLFNAVLLICDYPENVNCIATPYPVTTTTESPTEPYTDPSTISTVNPISTTVSGMDSCVDQPNDTLLEYPWNCKLYIRCENETSHIEECKDGRIFNSILQICDFPENTECKEEQLPSSETPTEPTVETTTTLPPGSTNPPYVGTGICENIERGTSLPYPGRCDLFILCTEPAPTTFSCPSGMEFDPEKRYCRLTEEAGCSVPRVTPETITTTEATRPIYPGICSNYPNGDLIPYPGNCSQYINCDKPIPTAEECPTGLEFNAKLQICESVQDAGCSCPPSVQPATTPEPPSVTPSTPSRGNGICEDREDGELVAYPGDCTKFVICEKPIPSGGKCGEDMVFNADLGICDESTETSCLVPTLPPHIEYPSDPAMKGVCKNHQNGDLVAYPGNCNKYIRCQTPIPVAGTCKNGLLFNEILGICDTPDDVDCPGYTPTPKPGEGPSTEPSVPTNSTNGICKGHNPGDLLPYPGQCEKFIKCDNPVPYARTCENGFHFNAKLSICDDPQTAECESVIPSTPSPPNSSNICCGAKNGTLVAYPEDCTQYIQCIYPIPKALQCKNGLHYNAISQKCESIESAACQWYRPMCEDEEDGTVFPYLEDCKKYYQCSDGKPVLLPCTIGAVFDSTAGKCIPGDVCK